MAAPIKDTVRVNITNDTPRISVRGFSTGLIIGDINFDEDRTRRFNSPNEMLDAGFSSEDELYKKALVFMSQARSANEFIIGRRIPDSNSLQKIIFSDIPSGGTFTIAVEGETTANIDYDASEADIKSAVELLTTVTEVSVTSLSSKEFTIEFTGDDANTAFDNIVADASSLDTAITATTSIVQYGSSREDITSCYSSIKESDNDFFYVLTTSDISYDDKYSLAGLVESELRHHSILTSNSDVADTEYDEVSPDDIAEKIKAANYTKTHVIYTSDSTRFIDAGIVGLQITKTPGSSTFMYKNLIGVTADTISTEQRKNLRSKNCNFYESQGGRAIFKDGTVGSGEFIDISVGIAYLTVRMSETVYAGISTIEKLDYEENGYQVIESFMFSSLINYGVNNNLIKRNSILIIIPDIDDATVADKAARTAKNFKFKALLKGAIHTLDIDGSLSV